MGPQQPPDAALSHTSFHKDRQAQDREADLAARLYVLDVQDRLPGVQRLRDWILQALAPQPGERAVDVGCGTGSEVRRLATLVTPGGEAIGVDPDDGMRREALRRCADVPGASIVAGEAEALPFDDGSIEVLRCERVFQHLGDPEAAAREFARVLAPGGRVVVADSDWGSAVQSMGDPDVVRRIQQSTLSRMANPFAGRYLRGQLHRAGLVVEPDIAASAVIMPDEVMRRQELIRMAVAAALEDGSITAAEAAEHSREIQRSLDEGEAFLAVTQFAVLARKPG